MKSSTAVIACPLCGYTFNPATQAACAACPLHGGCNLVCCPNCGFETVDVNRSKLVNWVTSIRNKAEGLKRGGL